MAIPKVSTPGDTSTQSTTTNSNSSTSGTSSTSGGSVFCPSGQLDYASSLSLQSNYYRPKTEAELAQEQAAAAPSGTDASAAPAYTGGTAPEDQLTAGNAMRLPDSVKPESTDDSETKAAKAQEVANSIEDLLVGEPDEARVKTIENFLDDVIRTKDPEYIKEVLSALNDGNFGYVKGSETSSFFGAYAAAKAKINDGWFDGKDGKKLATQSIEKYVEKLQEVAPEDTEYQTVLSDFFKTQQVDVDENLNLNKETGKQVGGLSGAAAGAAGGAAFGALVGAPFFGVGAVVGGVVGGLIGGVIGFFGGQAAGEAVSSGGGDDAAKSLDDASQYADDQIQNAEDEKQQKIDVNV